MISSLSTRTLVALNMRMSSRACSTQHHGGAGSGGEQDESGDVTVDLVCQQQGANGDGSISASNAMENGLTSQLTNSVTPMPRTCSRTSLSALKSTFTSIGMIITQIEHAYGQVAWPPPCARSREQAREMMSRGRAASDCRRRPMPSVTLESIIGALTSACKDVRPSLFAGMFDTSANLFADVMSIARLGRASCCRSRRGGAEGPRCAGAASNSRPP